jgi:hypothetical protein
MNHSFIATITTNQAFSYAFQARPPSHQILDIRVGIPLLVFHAKYSQLFGSIAYIQGKDYGDQSALIEKLKKY